MRPTNQKLLDHIRENWAELITRGHFLEAPETATDDQILFEVLKNAACSVGHRGSVIAILDPDGAAELDAFDKVRYAEREMMRRRLLERFLP